MDGLTQRLVGQRAAFLHIHPAEAATGTGSNLDLELLVVLHGLKVSNVHDVLGQIDLPGAQSIRLGGSVAHEQDLDFVIRRLAIPVMRIGDHLVTDLILEALDHVRAGADRSGLHVRGALDVENDHRRVGQACRHIGISLLGLDGNGAGRVVSNDLRLGVQELGRVRGALLAFFTNPIQIFLDLGGRHFGAVAELDALLQLEGPGLVAVAGRSGLRQLRDSLNVIVKTEQGLTDAEAAAVPSGIGLQGRVDQAVGVHLAAKGQHLRLAGIGLLVAAAPTAACNQAAGQKACYQQRGGFLELFDHKICSSLIMIYDK